MPQVALPNKESLLSKVPSPDEIRRRLHENAAENRLLRSLWRISRRIHSGPTDGQETAEVAK
jgi:hypothetical protein